jgi:glycosyltransferase involved in cell wall biosynthesis
VPPHQRIGIIVPFKNAEAWIESCLFSIQRQHYENWQCVLVDDHSSDSSLDHVKQMMRRDQRFVCVPNEGMGIVDALNTALKHTSSEWITRMDADDIMPFEKLDRLWEALQESHDAVATGKVRYFSTEPVSDGYRTYEAWLNERIDQNDHWDWVYRECVIASANWLTHRDHVHFPKDVYPEDYNMVFDWYCKGLEVKCSPEVTHWWREHPLRTSRTSERYQQRSFFKLKIDRFMHVDRDRERPLVVMGNNAKTALMEKFLLDHGQRVIRIDQGNSQAISDVSRPQVLVGVYPPEGERHEVERWLNGHGLRMGVDWWWN